jgi:hypothetical protein
MCWNYLLDIWSSSWHNSNVHVWGRWKVTGIPCYWLMCLRLWNISVLTSQCRCCPPERSSGAWTEQLTSCVDLSLSLYWSAQFCMLASAQHKIYSTSELLTLCFDCVIEPSVPHYLACECCCCLQCSSELVSEEPTRLFLYVFKGY